MFSKQLTFGELEFKCATNFSSPTEIMQNMQKKRNLFDKSTFQNKNVSLLNKSIENGRQTPDFKDKSKSCVQSPRASNQNSKEGSFGKGQKQTGNQIMIKYKKYAQNMEKKSKEFESITEEKLITNQNYKISPRIHVYKKQLKTFEQYVKEKNVNIKKFKQTLNKKQEELAINQKYKSQNNSVNNSFAQENEDVLQKTSSFGDQNSFSTENKSKQAKKKHLIQPQIRKFFSANSTPKKLFRIKKQKFQHPQTAGKRQERLFFNEQKPLYPQNMDEDSIIQKLTQRNNAIKEPNFENGKLKPLVAQRFYYKRNSAKVLDNLKKNNQNQSDQKQTLLQQNLQIQEPQKEQYVPSCIKIAQARKYLISSRLKADQNSADVSLAILNQKIKNLAAPKLQVQQLTYSQINNKLLNDPNRSVL